MSEKRSKKKNSWPVFALIGLVAAAFGAFIADQSTKPPKHQPHIIDMPGAAVYSDGRALPAFQLTDKDGAEFTNARFNGKWSFVFFGYTYCPDVCPAALSNFEVVRKTLEEQGEDLSNTEFVFISVDPERDTTDRMKQYVEYFHPSFQAATGAVAEIDRLTRASGAAYVKVARSGDKDYLIDHSAQVFLINPKGELQGFFRAPHDPAEVASTFLRIRG